MQSRVTTFGTPSENNDGVRSPQRYFTTRNPLSIVRFLQAQPALGGLSGEKGQGSAGRNCEYDPISQFEPATLVPKRKTRLARQAPSWS